MRQTTWLFTCLLGCGRVGFDPHVDASTATPGSGSLLTVSQPPGESLESYPLLVTLDDTRADRSQIDATASNVRFYDAANELLDFQIERAGSVGGLSLLAWVMMPKIYSGATTSLRVTYARAPADNPSSKWPSEYAAVWHLDDDSDSDDAANGHRATANGTTSIADGMIGPARHFDQDLEEYLVVADSTAFVTSPGFTLSSWIRQGAITGFYIDQVTRQLGDTSDHDMYLGSRNDQVAATCATANGESGDDEGPIGSGWHHLVVTFDEPTAIIRDYIDGNKIGTGPIVGGALLSSSRPLFIGADRDGMGGPVDVANSGFFDGDIDELRIESTVRNAAWIEFDDLAMRDQVITYGPVE